MEKHFTVKMSIMALVALCMQIIDTSEAGQQEVDFLWDEQRWQGMTWFNEIFTYKGLVDKRKLTAVKDDYGKSFKLKTIPLLMGCGYGQKVTDFLWLATYTVTECRALSEDPVNKSDEDCWKQLDGCLKKGAHTISKVLLAFKQLMSFDARINIIHISFYHPLLAIKSFLDERAVKNGLTDTKATTFNQQMASLAGSLGNRLDTTCIPKHSVIDQEQLTNERRQQTNANGLHDFYAIKLRSTMEFITRHMLSIGFNYLPKKQEVTFTIPTTRAAATSK